MRRGLLGDEYVIKDGRYVFKLPRGTGDLKVRKPLIEPSKNPAPRPMAQELSIKKKYNRGATHNGTAKYTSAALANANKVKALNKIKYDLPNDYTDEINDELILLARERAAAKREHKLKAAAKSVDQGPQIVKYGGGLQERNKYGGMVTAREMAAEKSKPTNRGKTKEYKYYW